VSDRSPSGGPLVAEVAQMLLDGVVSHYADAGEPLPSRRYVAAGGAREVAYDCEQVTVALSGIGWGPSPDRSQGSQRTGTPMAALALRHAVFAVAVVRKDVDSQAADVADVWDPEADARFPSAEVMNRLGLRHMRDAALVSQALLNTATEVRNLPRLRQVGRELTVNPAASDRLVQPGLVESLGPAGGYVSVEAAFTVTVPDVG
jgi:hypothetical protein